MDLDTWARDVDIDVPSSARMYDYYLGGSHNFAADRQAADKVIAAMPQVPTIARANRAFLHRAVRYLLQQGVRQFLDIGSGIPTVGNVHEVTQRVAPDSRVVYADVDPVAVTLAQRLLEGNDHATAILADLRDPGVLLARPELRDVLDLSRPVGVLLVSVLHFVQDVDDPHGAVARLRDATVPGSWLVLSHGVDEGFAADQAEAVQGVYRGTKTPGGLRSRERIAAFFDGYELIDPGLVWLPEWRPAGVGGVDEDPRGIGIISGVGRRP
jgi:hypothetical protein